MFGITFGEILAVVYIGLFAYFVYFIKKFLDKL